MKLLLDTHAFLWFVAGDPRIGKKAKKIMEGGGSRLYLSSASIWEMAIKASLGRLSFDGPFEDFMESKINEGYHMLPVEWNHAAVVAGLAFHHKDPFDRLLIAQAMTERMPIITADESFKKYGVETIW
jgi:PIN domain nuclease of toxin-antitoxin system